MRKLGHQVTFYGFIQTVTKTVKKAAVKDVIALWVGFGVWRWVGY